MNAQTYEEMAAAIVRELKTRGELITSLRDRVAKLESQNRALNAKLAATKRVRVPDEANQT